MTKSELVEKVSGTTRTDAETVGKVTLAVFDAIKREVAKGGVVQIAGFGSFRARDRAARKGRNPRTGTAIEIPAHRIPAFKASAAFKELVNDED